MTARLIALLDALDDILSFGDIRETWLILAALTVGYLVGRFT